MLDVDYEYLNIPKSVPYYHSEILDRLYSRNRVKEQLLGMDNPLRHGTTVFAFKSKTDVVSGIKIFADILAEHRGSSYGDRSVDNMIVYPSGYLLIDKQILQRFSLHSYLGDKEDFRLNQGLYLFNQDLRCMEHTLRYKDIAYNFLWIGDLVNSVGLNTDDFFANNLILFAGDSSCCWQSSFTASLGLCLGDMDSSVSKIKNVYSVGATLKYKDLWDAYFSVGSRGEDYRDGAYLLGTKLEESQERREWKLLFESRYYDENFLRGLKSDVDYRDTDQGEFANTIGDQLYPLTAYDKPFSQLAVFSEYQGYYEDDGNKKLETDVWGVSLQGSWLERFYEFFASVQCDLNYIKPTEFAGSFYPFYMFEVGYEPCKDNKIALVMSNKGMNLNKNYQTFYAYKRPYFGFSFSRDLDFN